MYSQERGAGMDGDIAELGQGKLTRWCCGRVLALETISFAASTLSDPWTVLPTFSGQKVTERILKQETVSWGPGSAFSIGWWFLSQARADLYPFSTAIGDLVPWWSKGQTCLSIFGWL